MDLIQKNREMLLAGKYNVQDTRQLSRIASLSEPNDYDLYLIACALCNYDISEKAEARDLRMQLFLKTSNSGLDYSHKQSDYNKIETKLKCTNTGKTNKFGLYEYEINVNDRDLVSDLWEYKAKDCLKYVDNKTFPDKIIVSIGKNQLSNFKDMLDKLGIAHEKKNMDDGVVFTNKSTHKLIDLSELDLPFTPYDFQLEDAEKILKKKRALLGHDMGCGKTFISILIGCSIFNKEDVIYRTVDNLEYNDIVITDKGPLPIGKIVEENIDCKVQVIKNGITKFVNILERRCIEE